MNSNPNVKRLVQVSEEAAPAIHVPVIVGNECYIITQQDVRRIEDTRFLSYNKLSSNGQNFPVTVPGGYQCDSNLYAHAGATQPVNIGLANIEEIVKKLLNQRNEVEAKNNNLEIDDESELRKTVATLTEQLKWSKSVNTSKPCSIRYSAATSTTDLCPTTNCKCCQIDETDFTCTRACNTDDGQDNTKAAFVPICSPELCDAQQKEKFKKIRFMFDSNEN